MANSLIVRRTTEPARFKRTGRAAQYVRMSTDLQWYSTQNQAAAIAVYAAQHNLTIVRTYIPVQQDRRTSAAEQAVLQRAGQRRFSGAGQARQPDHGTVT